MSAAPVEHERARRVWRDRDGDLWREAGTDLLRMFRSSEGDDMASEQLASRSRVERFCGPLVEVSELT